MSYKDLFRKIGKNLRDDATILYRNIQQTAYQYLTPPWRLNILSSKEIETIRSYCKSFSLSELRADKETDQLIKDWVENHISESNFYDSFTNILIVQSSDSEQANHLLKKISYYYREIRNDKIDSLIDLDLKWVNRFTRYESFSLKFQSELESAILQLYEKRQEKLTEIILSLLEKRYDAEFLRAAVIYQLETVLDNISWFGTYEFDSSQKEQIYYMMEEGNEIKDVSLFIRNIIKMFQKMKNVSESDVLMRLLREYAYFIELENRNTKLEEHKGLEVN